MKDKKSIYDIETLNTDEELHNRKIKEKDYCCRCIPFERYLCFNFKFIGPLFIIINLIGVYQLINLLKATQKEMIFGIQSFLFEKNRTIIDDINEDIIPEDNITIDNITKHIIDIDNIIRNDANINITNIKYNPLEDLCFKNIPVFNLMFLTSIIGKFFLKILGFRISTFIFMIIISIIIFFYESFDFPQERYDNFYQVLLLILYYLFLLITVGSISLFSQQIYFDGLRKYINRYDEDQKRRKSFFSYLCFTEIPAYLINIWINYYCKIRGNENFFMNSFLIYNIFTLISMLIYTIYSGVFIKGNKTSENQLTKKVYRLCGYLIYCEKKLLKDDKKIDNNNYQKYCLSCRIGLRKFYKLAQDSLLLSYCCLCKCKDNLICNCDCYEKVCICERFCEWCDDNSLNELYQGEEEFCYCYKVQRKFSWFCDLLFKNDILEIIIIDIFLELSIIGFEKQINENLISNKYQKNFIPIILYLLYYLLFALFHILINKQCLGGSSGKRREFSAHILNLAGVTIWNFLFTTIISGISFFGNKNLKNFIDSYLILFPFALTKFYNFILMNSLVSVIDSNNIDLLSNSTIISLFMSIYQIFVFIIINLFNCSTRGLILFQFIFGIIGLLIIIYLFFLMIIRVILCPYYCIIFLFNQFNKKKELK